MRLRNTPAFSLIEMIMVLVVLVALAGMLVPQIDFMRRSADKGTASSVIKSLAENIQLYRTYVGSYPDNWDSMLDGSQALLAEVDIDGKGIVSPLSPEEAESLSKIGIETLIDHNLTTAYRGMPGDSADFENLQRAIAATEEVVVITDADIIQSVFPEDDALDAVISDVGAGGNYDARIVALGFGPHNQSVGKTLMSPPAYSGVDSLVTYNRYICLFAVYSPNTVGNTQAKRAQLVAVLDSAFDFLNQEIIEFNENALE